jgi:Tol biopolymer transport system component
MSIRLPQAPDLRTAVLALALAVAACNGEDSPLSPESPESPTTVEPAAVEPVGGTSDLVSLSGILFQSSRTGNIDIYRMAPDGTGAVRVTSFSGPESNPVWSWDHQRIAMVRNRLDGANVSHQDIYVMNADGSGKRWVRPVPSSFDFLSPSWSKDGKRLVVTVTYAGENRLALMDVATGSATFVNAAIPGPIGTGAHFDPSGQRLVYAGKLADTLHLINTDGTGHKVLFGKNLVGNPNFSPDGKKIAFGYSAPGETSQIYVKNLVDGTVKRVTTGGGFVPTWSPDGSKIAFASSRTGKNQIFVVPSAGGTETRITNNSYVEYAPSWAH